MKTRRIRIPGLLQELHGEETSLNALIMTYLAGVGLVVFSSIDYAGSGWKGWLLAFLAFDIGGGVVANLSDGTAQYYTQRPKSRWLFIGLHSLQPLLLALIFEESRLVILGLGLMIVLLTALLSLLRYQEGQPPVAGLFIVFLLVGIYVLEMPALAGFFLSLFAIKLLLAFALCSK